MVLKLKVNICGRLLLLLFLVIVHCKYEECRIEPLQTFNTQCSVTGGPGTRLGIIANHSPEKGVAYCSRG